MNKYLEKIAELEKSSGNRLVRYISENRENFPLSRLLSLSEKGVLKSPEQLLPGRNLGSKNQFEATARKYGLNIVDQDPSKYLPHKPGTAAISRGLNRQGGYSSKLSGYNPGNVSTHNTVPPLYAPVHGNHEENIRRLADTHVGNHETFEMDEGLRMVFGKGYNPATSHLGHHNMAVLLRESRDMSSNPYAHVVPPLYREDVPSKVINESMSKGLPIDKELEKYRAVKYDTSAAIPESRNRSGESYLISILQAGKPYQSNPTSSQIRKARSMTSDEVQSILGRRVKSKRFTSTLQGKIEEYLDRRGNKAFRN